MPLTGPVRVVWSADATDSLALMSAALDTGTREALPAQAALIAAALAPWLAGGDIAFKKVDSLLRGASLAELAACFQAGGWIACVFAPAFPFHGRVTRGGRHFWGATPVGPELVASLRALGAPARRGPPLAPGITVYDAETDAELAAIVRSVGGHKILWCGSGGLAAALTASATPQLSAHPSPPPLAHPVLGLFGSDQPATASQLAACGVHWHAVPDGGAASAARIATQLERGIALVSLDLPQGLSRSEAAKIIAVEMARLVAALPVPASAVVAGGETLRALCDALGASALEVHGSFLPGLPVSVVRGGAWDGVTLASKSGAFGDPDLLRELLLR